MHITMDIARDAVEKNVHEEHLLRHAQAVSAAMEAMAAHFGEDPSYWAAIGYAHDVDFEQYPQEHCRHVRELLAPYGLDEEDLRAIESHGWGLCSEVEPLSNMEKSLYTVDELTGIISAAALMRPTGISDLGLSSLKKKFKDGRFAAKCDRDLILKGCEMLAMEPGEVMQLCIDGMRRCSDELGLSGNAK
jgi:predicted hydrolase (HD superfamily)